MWALRACCGSQGIFNLHVCVETIFCPSGRLMTSGVVAGLILVTGVPGNTKWPVAPASAIALSIGMLMWEELNIVSAVFVLLMDEAASVVVVDAVAVDLLLAQLLVHMVASSSSSSVEWMDGYVVVGVGVGCEGV